MPPRSRPPPASRHDSSDDELSDLSDPEDENLPITSLGQSRRAPPPAAAESDDEEDEEDEEDDEADTTESDGEAEDSYVSVADSGEDSYEDSETPRNTVRGAALLSQQRAKAAKPTSTAAARSRKPTTSSSKSAVPTIKLKIRKDRLRAATSNWTPEPGAAVDSASSMAPTPAPVPITRRKVAIPDDDDEEEEDDDEELEEEDEEDEEDDEEEEEEEEEEEDITMRDVGDIDAEGEEDDELLDEDAEGETDEEMDDAGGAMGDGTPGDLSKMTNRQRTRVGGITADLMELPSGYGKSKAAQEVTLSAAEQELKRAEMARRRKHLTDQRLHEEKMDTINRLLKKQTPKMRGTRGTVGDAAGTPGGGDGASTEAPPPPTMVRWVSNKDGTRLGVPETWLQAGPVGEVFVKQEPTPRMRKLIEEI